MKKMLFAALAIGALAAPAFANLQLAQKNNCTACHAVDKKVVGPAYKDVAKKYAGDKTAEAKLIAKVKAGGAGVWGAVPMPPNAQVSDADVKARIEEMALSTPEVSFKACGNTQEKMQKAENKSIPIIKQAEVVKSGVVRVMELQEKGWAYVKP